MSNSPPSNFDLLVKNDLPGFKWDMYLNFGSVQKSDNLLTVLSASIVTVTWLWFTFSNTLLPSGRSTPGLAES